MKDIKVIEQIEKRVKCPQDYAFSCSCIIGALETALNSTEFKDNFGTKGVQTLREILGM